PAAPCGTASSSRRIPVLCIIVKMSRAERPRGSLLDYSRGQKNLVKGTQRLSPGSRAALPLPRPLRTHRASFPAVRSSLSNARLGGRDAAIYDYCCVCAFFFANDARGGFHR